jgi:uncharacterized membrane protein/Mg-chelatase subunit ChlD
MNIPWTPIAVEKPLWLVLMALAPVVVAVSLRTLAPLEPVRRALAIIVRCLIVIVLALCLAEASYVKKSDKLTVFFLMDRSDSVKEQQQLQEEYIHAVCKDLSDPHRDRDLVGMIDFARNAFIQQMPMLHGYYIEPGRLPDMDRRDRTDIAAALRLSLAMFPGDSTKRIVLMTDGNDNMGDVLAEAKAAQAAGVVVDVVPLWYQHRNEVYFDRLVAPGKSEEGELMPLGMVVHSEGPAAGRIDVYVNGKLIQLPSDYAHVTLQRGANPFVMKLPIHGAGAQRFEARFVPDDPARQDSISENNVATAFTYVGGKSQVLLLSSKPEDDQALADALAAENIPVELRDVSSGDIDMLSLLNYSSIILANVSANTFTSEQQQTLAHYVSNLGGGLIMTGGDDAFGAGGWIGTPVAAVMPVQFEIKHKRVIPRGALVLVVHSCEINRGNYWGVEVAKASVDTISSRDYIGVLAYTWSPGGESWVVPLQLAGNKPAIKGRIDKMQNGDMPDFESIMSLAVKDLKTTDAAQKHIILISDGDPSAPAASTIKAMVDAKITCSTVGIGYGAHVIEQTLKDIATKTGGRFYPCRNPKLLPQIFVKESKLVRRSLVSNEPFSPQVQYAYSELLAGIDPNEALPPLGGMVLTSPRTEAQTALVRVGKDETADPVLAHWQAGLGRTVAFTSGFWPHWGGQWVAWPKFSKLWAQIVRWTMRQEAPTNLDVFTRVDGNKGRVVVDAVDKDAAALNMLSLPAVVIRPDQTVQPLMFQQTGPGHYEADFDVDQTGQFIANVGVNEGGEFKGSLQAGLSVPFSPEFKELRTNEALLRKVVETTGGRWHENISEPERHDIFLHNIPPVLSRQPVWDWLIRWVFLPLFLLDVAVRRLASWLALSIVVELLIIVFLLFGVGTAYGPWWGKLGTVLFGELVGWTIRFRSIGPLIDFLTHTASVLGRTGERSTESLGQLKDVRERVREARPHAELPTRGKGGQPTEEEAPDRTRRFDAGDEATSKPAADLTDVLGGAQAQTPGTPARPPAPSGDKPADEGDVTGRLLRAKRRARQDMDDTKDQGGDKPK